MECLYCNGEMERKQSSYTLNRKGYHLLLDKIPVYICSKCGQKYFEDKEIDEIQKMVRHLEADLYKIQAVG